MKAVFEVMREESRRKIVGYSSKSYLAKACSYFLENYQGLTRFLDYHLIPVDNNSSEYNFHIKLIDDNIPLSLA